MEIRLLSKCKQSFASLSLYARLAIFCLFALFLLVAWYFVLVVPVESEDTSISVKTKIKEKTIETLRQHIKEVKAGKYVQEPLAKDDERGKLRAQLNALEHEIEKLRKSKKVPENVEPVLKKLIAQEKDLHFVSLKNETPKLVPAKETSKSYFYEHPMKLIMRGNYFSTMRYLQQLEQSHWHFIWESMKYQVSEYPQATVALTLSTFHQENDKASQGS